MRGAVGIARSLAIPPLLIGLTVVGFGTSLSELGASFVLTVLLLLRPQTVRATGSGLIVAYAAYVWAAQG